VGCARLVAIEIIANAAQRGAHAAANEVPLAREKKERIKKRKKGEEIEKQQETKYPPYIGRIFLSVIYKNALNITLRSVQQ